MASAARMRRGEGPAPTAQAGPDRRPHAALAALLLVGGLLLLHLQRDTTFFRDEWAFVLYRPGLSLSSLLSSHAGNLSALPVAIYVLTFRSVGLDHHVVLTLVQLVALLALGWALHAWSTRRVGPWWALLPVASVLTLGAAWDDLLWAFQVGYLISLATVVAALTSLERDRPRADALAVAALCVAVSSSSIGLAGCVAALVAVVLRPRPRWATAVAIVAIVVLWVAWSSHYAGPSRFALANLATLPEGVATAAAAAVGGATALGATAGMVLALALGAVVARAAALDVPRARRLAPPVAFSLAFWTLISLAPLEGSDSASSRYVLPGVVGCALVVTELARGRRRLVHPPHVVWLAGAAVLVALGANVVQLANEATVLRATSAEYRARLAAVDASSAVPPGTTVSAAAYGVDATAYLGATRLWGSSPATPLDQLARMPEAQRQQFDATSVVASGLALVPTDLRGTRCTTSATELVLPPTGVVVRSGDVPTTVQARRVATQPAGIGTVPARSRSVLRAPRDRLDAPWRVRLSSGALVCAM